MSTRNRLRAKLSLTTALVGGAIGISAPTRAQPPVLPNFTGGVGNNTVVIPTPVRVGDRLDVNLANNSRSVITWNGFDVGTGGSVNFIYNNAAAGAVLNRITGPATTINGAIGVNTATPVPTAGPLSVYLINPNGITFGTGANVNVGALIASTLAPDTGLLDVNFLAGIDPTRFTGATGFVRLTGNAQLRSTAGEVVLLGATVAPTTEIGVGGEAGTSVTAATDAAFILANDVTITRAAGSPLAFTLGQGTAVAANLVSAGSVSGRNVTLALASRENITDALLVSGNVTATTATATERGIVLAAGVSTGGVTVTAGDDTAGSASLTHSAGTLLSGGRVIAAAKNGATMTGPVDANGASYAVSGTTVTLGGTQSAAGLVTITAANSITGNANLRLTSNDDGTAGAATTERLQLTTTATGGAVTLDVGSVLTGGNATNRSNIVVDQADATSTLAMGGITGAAFSSSTDGGATPVAGATRGSALRFGDIDLTSSFALNATAGDVTVGRVTIGGAAQTLGLTSAAGSVVSSGQPIQASGTVTISSATGLTSVAGLSVTSTGADVDVTGPISASAGGVTIAANATTGTATVRGGVTATGGDYAVSGNTVTLGTAGTPATAPIVQSATGSITLTAGTGGINSTGALTLTANSDNSAAGTDLVTLAPGGGAIALGSATINGGANGTSADVYVGSGDTAITLGTTNARQLRTDAATAQITRTNATVSLGTVTTTDALDVRVTGTGTLGAGNVNVTGGSLDLATDATAISTGTLAGDIVRVASNTGTIQTGAITSDTSVSVQSAPVPGPGVGNTVSVGQIAAGGDVTVRGSVVSFTGTVGTDAAPVQGDVLLESTAGDLSTPQVFSTGGVTLRASRDAIVADTVAARGGALQITAGRTARLGDDAGTETISAAGAINISAGSGDLTGDTTGGIVGGAGLTLQSAAGAANAITLSTAGAAQNITFAANSSIVAGAAPTGPGSAALRIQAANDQRALTLGTVRAASLEGAIGAGGFVNGLARAGLITVGDVTLVNTLSLTSTAPSTDPATLGAGIVAGNLAVTGAERNIVLTTTGGGSIRAGSGTAALGSIAYDSSAALTLTGALNAVDVSLLSVGALSTQTINARDDIVLASNLSITGADGTAWTSGATLATGEAATDLDTGFDDPADGTPGTGNTIFARAPTIDAAGVNSTGAGDNVTLIADTGLLRIRSNAAGRSGSIGGELTLDKNGAADTLSVTGTLFVGTGAESAATITSDSGVTLGTVGTAGSGIIASGDLTVTAPGAVTVVTGGGRDIRLTSTGSTISATTLTARDDILLNATSATGSITGESWTSGTTVTLRRIDDSPVVFGPVGAADGEAAFVGNDIEANSGPGNTGQISIRSAEATGASSDVRLNGQAGSDLDFALTSGGDISLVSDVTARDIALRAGGNVNAVGVALTAADDVAIRAGGTIDTGAITSGGTATPTDSGPTGAADLLPAIGRPVDLARRTIDLDAGGRIRTGALTANGGDIAISSAFAETGDGIAIGTAGVDLVLTANDGSITIFDGIAGGRDLRLTASGSTGSRGSITTRGLRAQDDLVLAASATNGIVTTTGTLLSGVSVAGAGALDTEAALPLSPLFGNDVDVSGAVLGIADAIAAAAANSDVRLAAAAGDLRVANSSAGANVTLTKQGTTGGLFATGDLTAGTQATGAASVSVTSTTTATLNRLTAGSAADGIALARDVAVTVAPAAPAAVGAANSATITGQVFAARNYTVDAGRVTLGTAGTGPEQAARGAVSIVSRAGAISGLGTLQLIANSDDTQNPGANPLITVERLTLDATGGAIDFAAGTTLLGGRTNSASNIEIALGTPGSALTLGTVRARSLRAVGSGAIDTTGTISLLGDVTLGAGLRLTTTQAITTRNMTVEGFAGGRQPLILRGASITANGVLRAQGNIDLTATAGNLALNGTGVGAVSEGGDIDYAVTGGDATGTGLSAAGDITGTVQNADTIAFADAGVAGTLLNPTDLNPDLPRAPADPDPALPGQPVAPSPPPGPGDVRLTAGSITKTSITGRDIAIDATTGDIAATVVTARDDIAARAVNGTISGVQVGGTALPVAWTAAGGVDADGSADALLGAAPGHDITAIARRVILTGSVTASGAGVAGSSDLTLTATAGQLQLGDSVGGVPTGTVDVGGSVTLIKQGNAEELAVIAPLTTGLVTADAATTLSSTTSARINAIVSRTGSLTVTAREQVTGLATGTGFGRATLTTLDADAAPANSDIVVTVGDGGTAAGAQVLALLGTLTSSNDILVQTGAAGAGAPTIDLVRADARDIALDANNGAGRVSARTLNARDDIAVRAAGAIAAIADPALTLTTTWTSGTAPSANEVGRADTLAALIDQPADLQTQTVGDGNDIVARGLSLALTTATANGDASDIRLVTTAGPATLGTLRAGQNLAVTAGNVTTPGDIVLTDGGAIDIALDAAGAVTATTLTARDDIAVRATGAIAGGTWESGATLAGFGGATSRIGDADTLAGGGGLALLAGPAEAVPLGGNDIVAQGGSLTLGTGTAAGDLFLRTTAADLTVTTASARDIALQSAAAITATTLTARDDIALRAAGTVTGTSWTSGESAADDVIDFADQLAAAQPRTPAQTLAGNDIDVIGTRVTIGAAVARGALSDVRIDGLTGGIVGGDPVGDLFVDAGGNIELAGTVSARDVGLIAGGSIDTDAITALDDIAMLARSAINSSGTLTTGTAASVDGAAELVAARLPAGNLLPAGGLAGNDILIDGASFTGATTAPAIVTQGVGGDLFVLARSGRLAFTGGTVAGAALLDKRGLADELAVSGTLTTGTVTTNPVAEVATTILTDSNARIDTIVSRGTLTVSAFNDADDAGAHEVTGIGAGGRATLTTTDMASDVIVTVGTAATQGALAALATVSGARDVLLTANGTGAGTLAPTLDAVTLTAARDIVATAGSAATSTRSLVRVASAVADRDISILASGTGTGVDAPTIALTSATARRDITLRANTVSTDTLSAGDDLWIRANGPVSGTSWASGATVAGAARPDEDGIADTLALAETPAVSLLGHDLDVSGSLITIATVRAVGANGDVRLRGPVQGGGTAGDLDIDAGGDIDLFGDADARDAVLNAGGAIRTAAITTTDDLVLRAGTLLSTGTLLSGPAAGGAQIDVAGAADARRPDLVLTGNAIDAEGATVIIASATARGPQSDLSVIATGGALTLGSGAARDIALRATGDVTATTLTARDDIAIRAGGRVTGDSWTSGTEVAGLGPVDEAGVADALLSTPAPAVNLAGNDIDVAGLSIDIGTVEAIGAGSDVRLRGPVSGGDGARDLVIRTGGNINLVDAAQGRDVALSAGGTITTAAITARDDVAIRADGAGATGRFAISTGAIASGQTIGALAAVDVTGAADALLASPAPAIDLTGNDIDVRGPSIFAPLATAAGANSDLRLTATSGRLELTEGSAGAAIALTKEGADLAGSDDVLQLTGRLTGGTVSADADVVLTSSTEALLGEIVSTSGNLTVEAATDIAAAVAGTPVILTVSSATKDARVTAGRSATIGTITSGRDIAVTAGTAGGAAGAITLTAATGRDIALNAIGGSLNAITLTARDDIAVRADAAATGALWTSGADPAGDSDATGFADVLASGAPATGARWPLTTLTGATSIVASVGGALALAEAQARGGNVAADAASIGFTTFNAGLATDLTARAGSIAGTTSTSIGATTLAARDGVTLTTVDSGPLGVTAGGAIAITTVAATGATALDGGSIAVEQLSSGGNLTAIARTGDLRLATGAANSADVQGSATLTTVAGDILLGTLRPTGSATLTSASDVRVRTIESGGAIAIAAAAGEVTGLEGGRGDLSAGGTVGVAGGSLVRLGAVTAGTDIGVTADTIDITQATATGGTLTLTADAGNLTLVTGRSGGAAAIATTGGAGDVSVTTLNAGGTASIASVSDARLGDITSGGAIQVTAASGEVTGIGPAAANLTARGGPVRVTGGTLARLGTVDASGLIDVTADSIDAATTTARGGTLSLVADAGPVRLGNGSASTSVTLTASGALGVSGTVAANGGNATLRAASATVGTASAAQALSITTTAGALTLGSGTGGTTAALSVTGGNAGVGTLTATSQSATVTVTGGSLQLTNARAGTGAAITVSGGSAVVGTLNAGQSLTANVTGGNLQLRDGTVGTTAELNVSGETVIGTAGAPDTGGLRAATSVVIRANELDLFGRLTTPLAMIVNRSANPLVLGTFDGTSNAASTVITGFDLSGTEVNRIFAPRILFVQTNDAGAAPLRQTTIGNITLLGTTGSQRIDVLTQGRIDLYGTISDAGSPSQGRTLRLGGSNTGLAAGDTALREGVANPGTVNDGTRATAIVATATAGGGGRILLGSVSADTTSLTPAFAPSSTATVDLRANRIAFGLQSNFLADPNLNLANGAAGADFATVAQNFISQPNSTLYRSTARNPNDTYTAPFLLTATSVEVRYGDYALFQNTGQLGGLDSNNGVVVKQPLRLFSSGDTSPNGLALFGFVNNQRGSAAALQTGGAGSDAPIRLSDINPANSRINGCLVGSGGGGCLISTVVTPVLNIFDEARANIFRTADDLAVQFDPVVGTNNESLFSDLGTIDFQFDDQKCDPATDSTCPAQTPSDQ